MALHRALHAPLPYHASSPLIWFAIRSIDQIKIRNERRRYRHEHWLRRFEGLLWCVGVWIGVELWFGGRWKFRFGGIGFGIGILGVSVG